MGCAFHLRVNNRRQDELDDIRHKVVAYARAHMHAKHKSPSIPRATLRRWRQLGRELGKEKERDGSWRSEFTAFNIGKMKYDRGRRASKELPFCGIDKFILLPRFVGGWSNFDHHLPMCPRVSITIFSNVPLF